MKRFLPLLALAAALLPGAPGSAVLPLPAEGQRPIAVEQIEVDSSAVSALAPAPSDPACAPEPTSEIPTGLLVHLRGDVPTQLVVFAHGFGHNVEDSWLDHMKRFALPGVAIVATNYRDNYGFPALRGAHDTVAATLLALDAFPSIETVYLLGVSMGGSVSGTALVESTYVTEDGSSLYDYWIDVEGVSQLTETWAEAKAVSDATGNSFAAEAEAGIVRDTGGTPVECLPAFARRSPALQAFPMAAAGLRAATVIHSLNDGLVPYDQGREMADALVAAGVPTQFFTVLRSEAGDELGTTATGSLGLGALDPMLSLAGHASEADAEHPVMRTGFETLEDMLFGTYDEETPYQEFVVDVGL